VLLGSASISNGQLYFDNRGNDHNIGAGNYFSAANLGETTAQKTLVVWATLNATQQGGSVLTMETDNKADFDAVGFGERTKNQWLAGSGYYTRTPVNNGGALETFTPAAEVQIAIVYGADNSITIYHNGVQYVKYTMGSLRTFTSNARALIGLRHSTCGFTCFLTGSVNEARIYNLTLTAEQVQSLSLSSSAPPPPTSQPTTLAPTAPNVINASSIPVWSPFCLCLLFALQFLFSEL